jgi:hypothetical protein
MAELAAANPKIVNLVEREINDTRTRETFEKVKLY